MDVKENIAITVPSEEKLVSTKESEPKVKKNTAYQVFKRIFDIVLSAIGLVLTIIPMIVIACLIRIGSEGKPIYVHNRVGKNGKLLPLLKFRTMYLGAEDMINDFTPEQKAEWEKNFKLDNDPRITKIGKFLRRSSLDELPQLINVLKGELSLVGPRPVVEEEIQRHIEDREKFLSVTPGLTGYWQAYARSTCTYEERVKMELYYVDNANFWWDIKILFATVSAVFSGRGAK